MLRRAQCDRSHRHEPLIGGKAKACEVYPDPFVELICEGIRKELEDVKWRDKIAEKLDIGDAIEKIMSITEALESIGEIWDDIGIPTDEAPSAAASWLSPRGWRAGNVSLRDAYAAGSGAS